MLREDSALAVERKKREKEGVAASKIALLLNLMLFIAKMIVGYMANSIAVVGDAVNNLSDFVSSSVSWFSFKYSTRPADSKHPFGHARIEYIASSIVGALVLWIGGMLLSDSISRIRNPQEIRIGWPVFIVLMFSILVKLGMFFWQRRLAKKIGSAMLRATAMDSIADVVTTAVILVAVAGARVFDANIDGYVGVVASIFIFRAGFEVLRDNFDQIMGQKAPKSMRKAITDYILEYEGVLGMHDLMVHMYGPDRVYATAHVEVSAKQDLMKSHLLIDTIERKILLDLGIHLVVHMDPVITDDPEVNGLKQLVHETAEQLSPELYVHDFRTHLCHERKDLIFEIDVPDGFGMENTEIRKQLTRALKRKLPEVRTYITIDRNYEIDPEDVDQAYE